jgi:hypothetical protein
MKSLLAIVVAAAVFLVSLAHAADAADPERLAEARAILAATHMDRQIDGMAGAMADSMAKQFARPQPDRNPRVMQVMMEESMRGMKEQLASPGGMLDIMAQAYAAKFTFGELRVIREFYESPTGQHMLLATPELMRDLMPRMIETARLESPRSCARAKERLIAEKVAGGAELPCPQAP